MTEPVFPEPVIVPLDELMRQFAAVPLDVVRKALACQGLHLVTEAERRLLALVRGVVERGDVFKGSAQREICQAVYVVREAEKC